MLSCSICPGLSSDSHSLSSHNVFFLPMYFPQCFLSLSCRSCVVCILVWAGYLLVSCLINFDQLHLSIMVSFYCKRRFTWRQLRATLLCHYKNKHWEYGYVFKKEVVTSSPIWSLASSIMNSGLGWLDLQCSAWIPS